MWSRAQLKEKAKGAVRYNYWKVILVTLIVFIIGGATSVNFSYIYKLSDEDAPSFEKQFEEQFEEQFMEEFEDAYEDMYDEPYDEPTDDLTGMEFSDQYYYEENSDEYWEGYYDGYFGFDSVSSAPGDYSDGYNDGVLDAYYEDGGYSSDLDSIMEGELPFGFGSVEELAVMVFGAVVIIFTVILIIAGIIWVFASTVFFNPLEVGTKRFFFKNLNQKAEVKEVAYAFDNSYKNVVKILFIRNLCIFGWSLLLIIPGIIKKYEYMMIPYLLAENPNLTKEQAFALSKQMMTGNKWKAFVLHLSFIGWDFLSSITLGIVGVFYVQPYRCLTFAALYEELSLINGRPAFSYQPNMGNGYYQANSYGQPNGYYQTDSYGQPNAYEQPNTYYQTNSYGQPNAYEQPANENTYNAPEQKEI